MYSKDLRRNLKGIMKASRDLFLLILLYMIIISIFSFIGINLIGRLENVDLRT
jgi:two pore calcium channel protein 1/two pore calcium channel protein 3